MKWLIARTRNDSIWYAAGLRIPSIIFTHFFTISLTKSRTSFTFSEFIIREVFNLYKFRMKETLWLLDADYGVENGKGVILLYCLDKEGKCVLVQDGSFDPFFYAMPEKGKAKQLKERIEQVNLRGIAKLLKVEVTERLWEGKPVQLVKIAIDNPRKLKDVRDVIKNWSEVVDTYEYAESYYRRYLLYKQIEPCNWIEVEGDTIDPKNFQVDRAMRARSVKKLERQAEVKLKVLAFDTEWVEEDGTSKLIMLSLADNSGLKKVLTRYEWQNKPEYVEVCKDERHMIERFMQLIEERNPDVITGYNSDDFDLPKLRERAECFNLKFVLGRDRKPLKIVRRARVSAARSVGRVHVDTFNFVNNILSPTLRTEVLTLDAVAQELLGVGKEEMPYKEMRQMWEQKQRLERLAAYSMWDAELALKLAEFLLPQMLSLSSLTSELLYDVARYTYSQLVEGYLMKCAIADGALIPYRPKTEEIERRKATPPYKGAIVIEPKKGIHSDILVCDFASLYPTIIVTHNISPETLNCEHEQCRQQNAVPELGYHFCIEQKGFIPKHLEHLILERRRVKKFMRQVPKDSMEWRRLNNIQQAMKIVANATYGYMAFFAARWYKRECGAAVAAFGRNYIKRVIELARQEGFEIIYADTDGVFLKWKG